MPPFFVTVLFVLMSSSAWAAIDCVDANKVEFYDATPTDPESIAYTVPNATDRITFVGVGTRTGTQRTMTITGASATWTEVATPLYHDSIIGVNLYYALNATAGATTIGVNYNTAPLADMVIVWTCSGVNQVTPFRTPVSATGGNNTPTVTDGSVLTNDVIVDFWATDMSGSAATEPTVGANQTVINAGHDGAEIRGGASYQAGTSGGGMSWTFDDLAQQWAIMATSLIPASTPSRTRIAPLVAQ